MMQQIERQLENELIGRVRRAAHYRIEALEAEAIVFGPERERTAILAELARQGRWASMVGRLGYPRTS